MNTIFENNLNVSEEDAMYSYYNIYNEEFYLVLDEFFSGKYKLQPWDHVPFERVFKIWNDYIKMGFIRDEKGIDNIADTMIRNVARLQINTELTGHTQEDPAIMVDEMEGYEEWTEDVACNFADYIDDGHGQLKISDYALEPLVQDSMDLIGSASPEEKLQIIDRMFNRIHMRGDIAELFLAGGTQSYNKLAGLDDE